ncbi:hypothetical protein CRM22_010215 [Opisthorchis felineus]|uniref:Transglutaminase-like domain-containing protein n=1 Tax=Opisthorchis felineus TaxID=147828 RepID=A0A4S2L0I8_OPIFE|nr:hypothetical protein CRM22_010215 [Opisthorchis felineus]
MYAPPGFHLPSPLSEDSHPPPGLPQYLKHQVYDQPDVFSKVDEHAIQVAGCEHPAFRDLIWDLVYRYRLDELERARVIFRWMSSKDMQNIRFESSPPNSPEEVLMSFKHNRGTFARIFEIMCSYSGIHCVTLSGYAKGVDYLPGDRFSGLPPNHSWNVVHIRGSWQLIDVHWAARYLSSGRNAPENVVYEYDDFYFMMEPQQAVYSHFPEDPCWQLLPVPLTLSQFENLPLTKSQFFKCAIDFLEQHHGVVFTRDGLLRMVLGFWRPGGFTYKLQYLTNSSGHPHPEQLSTNPSELSDSIPSLDVDLKNFVLQETTKDRLNFYFRLPASGVYYLTIYAQELSNLTVDRESTFRAACEYKIICDRPAVDSHPYPTCHDANWGPAWPHVYYYALEPSHTDGVISVTAKEEWNRGVSGSRTPPPVSVDIRFGKQRPEVNLLAKLHRNGVPDEFLDQYQRVTETMLDTTFHVTLPEPGEYGLEIYANEPAEGDTYTHMCQYLVHYEAPPGWNPTPRLTASGADAGPSPEAVKARGSSEATGDRVFGRLAVASKWPVDLSSPLREMYDYEMHAPSMGVLPRPYAESQYTEPAKYRSSRHFSPVRNVLSNEGNPRLAYASPASGPSSRHVPSAQREEVADLSRSVATIHLSKVRDNGSGQHCLVESGSDTHHHNAIRRNGVPVRPRLNKSVTLCRTTFPRDSTEYDILFRRQPYMLGVFQGKSPQLGYCSLYGREARSLFATEDMIPQTSQRRPLSGPEMIHSGLSTAESGLFSPHTGTSKPTSGLIFGQEPGIVQTQSASERPGFGPQALHYGRVDSPGQHSGSSHPELDSGCNGNGSVQYSQVSPPGSAISSVSTQRLPFYRQQYDQFSATTGGSPGYAPSGQFYRPDQSTANWSAGPIQQEPPKEFSLLPISTETYVEKPRPQDLPSIGDKSTVPFGSFDVFRRVDEHAVSISQQQQDSFKQLIWQLIYARNITDELEKVRVIFLWLCTKDLHKMNFDNVKPDSPEEILMGIRTGKSTYAQIFYTLCRYAGLHCKLLIGYAKGAEYAPGMQFSGRQGQHSWNAVLVDKVWRLVDCHWAARRLIGKRPSPENVRYGLDMFYFLANPGQLIYTHFPHDSDWQLLRHPITLKEFENLAPVKSAFFKYNLDLITHRNAVIVCTDPEVCVVIAFPPQAEKYLSFTFGLSIDNKEGSEEYRGLPLT